MTEDLKVLKERVNRLRKLHLRALGSYHALEQMLKFTAPNIVGKDQADKNAQAFERYAGYLMVARHALETEAHLSLAKIYDDHKDALHIVKLLNYVDGNKKKLTTYKKLLDDPAGAQELADVYEGLTAKERQRISKDLDAASDKIRRLKDIRDKIVAHEDLKAPEGGIEGVSYQDLSDLIDLHEKIINTISGKHYGETMFSGPYRDDVIAHSQSLLSLIADDYDRFLAEIEMDSPPF